MGAIRKNNLHAHFGKIKARRRSICITSANEFFRKNKEVVYKINTDSIIFKVPDIDDVKNRISVNQMKYASTVVIISEEEIGFGDYLIDEETITEDEITIYLK